MALLEAEVSPSVWDRLRRDIDDVHGLSAEETKTWCGAQTAVYRSHINTVRAIANNVVVPGEILASYSNTLGVIAAPDGLPDEERKQLEGLALEEVMDWCHVKLQDYRGCIRALRKLYNAAVPAINRSFPIEIFMEIFCHFEHRDRRRGGTASIHVLRVCSVWRAILLRTAEFWANMLSTTVYYVESPKRDAFPLLRLALNHSGTLPFSLRLPGYPIALTDLLRPNVHRITSLIVKLASGESRSALENLLQGGMQQLRTLRTSAHRYGEKCFVVLPRSDAVPGLAELYTTAFNVNLERPYAALRSLELVQTSGVFAPREHPSLNTFDHLLRVLGQFPQLETLDAYKIAPASVGHLQPLHQRAPAKACIHLPRLRCLELTTDPCTAAALLSRFVLPQSTRVKLCHSTSGIGLYLPHVFAYLYLPTAPHCVRVNLSNSTLRLQVFGPCATDPPSLCIAYEGRGLHSANFTQCANSVAEFLRPVRSIAAFILDVSWNERAASYRRRPPPQPVADAEIAKVWAVLLQGFARFGDVYVITWNFNKAVRSILLLMDAEGDPQRIPGEGLEEATTMADRDPRVTRTEGVEGATIHDSQRGLKVIIRGVESEMCCNVVDTLGSYYTISPPFC